jgi:hypothetical protein
MLWHIQRSPGLFSLLFTGIPLVFIERSDGVPTRMIDSALTQSFANHLAVSRKDAHHLCGLPCGGR